MSSSSSSSSSSMPSMLTDLNASLLVSSLARLSSLMINDVELATAICSTDDRAAFADPRVSRSLSSLINVAFDQYAARPFLATRRSGSDEYDSISYARIKQRVANVIRGFVKHGIIDDVASAAPTSSSSLPSSSSSRLPRRVGILGFSTPSWVVAHFACMSTHTVFVPMQTGLTVADTSYIIRHADLTSIVVSNDKLSHVQEAIRFVEPSTPTTPNDATTKSESDGKSTVTSIIVMDDEDDHGNVIDSSSSHRIDRAPLLLRLRTIEIEGAASSSPSPSSPSLSSLLSDDSAPASGAMTAIMYTSGSTGRPKGAIFGADMYRRLLTTALNPSPLMSVPYISMAYLPFAHLAGLFSLYSAFITGGCIKFVQRSDMSTLLDDIRVGRPTTLMLVPRVCEMLHAVYVDECDAMAKVDTNKDAASISASVMDKLRYTLLGDRITSITVGTAPLSATLLSFLHDCLRVPVIDAYGQTEVGMITYDGHIHPLIREYKLVDVPSLGYSTSDQPHPRGELRVKPSMLISGYMHDAGASSRLIDEQGFVRTGDVFEELATGQVRYIDRVNNVIKLSQGEFVAVSHIESVLQADGIYYDQIYVHGNSSESYLVAVITPNYARIAAAGIAIDDIVAVKQAIFGDLARIASDRSLQSYEVPRAFILSDEPFSVSNQLLTESDKPARAKLKSKYAKALTQLYAEVNESRAASSAAAAADMGAELNDPTVSIDVKMRRGIASILGVPSSFDASQVSFKQLGGDSISAVLFCSTIAKSCGVSLPVAMVLDGATRIDALIKYAEDASATGADGKRASRATFASIHGASDVAVVRASDLKLESFITLPSHMRRSSNANDDDPRHVMITGANGYLGRFLLLDLLHRIDGKDGAIVTVIVRAHDDANAMERLRQSYGDSSVGMLDAAVGSTKLNVLAGDVMKPKFGLSSSSYDQLASSVDLIIHNGALVNHSFTYEQLFDPNVIGTVEVMKLAAAGDHPSSITFISSVGVLFGAESKLGRPVLESDTAASIWPTRPNSSEYALGYSTSKWAAEVLLEQYQRATGTSVNIVRCGMILANVDMAGQVNTSDFLTRLFVGLIATKMRPASFYEPADAAGVVRRDDAGRILYQRRPHFDGTPVNIVAAGIIAFSLHAEDSSDRVGARIYHSMNLHDDGVALDQFVDWIESAGYHMRTVADYDTWLREYTAALKSLPSSVRSSTNESILFQIAHTEPRPLSTVPTMTDRDAASSRLRYDDDSIVVGNSNFVSALRRFTEYDDVPQLSESYMHGYVRNMAQAGLIDAPMKHEGDRPIRGGTRDTGVDADMATAKESDIELELGSDKKQIH